MASLKELNTSLGSSFKYEKVDEVIDRKYSNSSHKYAFFRALFSAAVAVFLFTDLYEAYLGKKSLERYVWITVEFVLAALSMLYSISELTWLFHQIFMTGYRPTEITAEEKKLLGVLDNDLRFKVTPRKQSTPLASKPLAPKFSPSVFMPATPVTTSSPPSGYRESVEGGLSTSLPVLPSNHLLDSWRASPRHRPNATIAHNETSFNLNPLPGSGLPSPKKYIVSGRSEDHISTFAGLDNFLDREDQRSRLETSMRGDSQAQTASNSFWNTNRSVWDNMHVLRRLQYQVSPKTAQISSTSKQDDDQPHRYSAQETFKKLKIDQGVLDLWVENLRYWIGQTILQRLAKEIVKVNSELRRLGSDEIQIGETSVSTLKTVAMAKSASIPTLNNIIPYLEVTSHQEYLVARVAALGNDGCIAAFNWDGGDKTWKDHLPTDSAIVMHLLCTYIDSRMPANPRYPDGKVFTSQHFMASPDKPNLMKKNYLSLYYTKVNPPHYKLILADDIYDITPGRNNLFHAILFFFHYISEKEGSLLGHVNIGQSGLNVKWVLTHKYR